jgi:hypothetical protein
MAASFHTPSSPLFSNHLPLPLTQHGLLIAPPVIQTVTLIELWPPLCCASGHIRTPPLSSQDVITRPPLRRCSGQLARAGRAGTSLIAEPVYFWSGGVEEAGLGLTPAFYSLCCWAAICLLVHAGCLSVCLSVCQYRHN